jgi:hypothetical protein
LGHTSIQTPDTPDQLPGVRIAGYKIPSIPTFLDNETLSTTISSPALALLQTTIFITWAQIFGVNFPSAPTFFTNETFIISISFPILMMLGQNPPSSLRGPTFTGYKCFAAPTSFSNETLPITLTSPTLTLL